MWKSKTSILIFILLHNIYSSDKTKSKTMVNEGKDIPDICEQRTMLGKMACIPNNYMKEDAPERPTIIKTKLEIDNVREINDKEMRLAFEVYLELLWVDNRIITFSTDKPVVLNNNIINKIWKPDLWIKNLYNFKVHTVVEPTSGLMITKDNDCNDSFCTKSQNNADTIIHYNMEAEVSVYCNFKFDGYPMDTQSCEFVMDGSYCVDDVVIFEYELGLFRETEKNVLLDEFDIEMVSKLSNNKSGINSKFVLKRNIFPFFLKYYLPSAAIVIMASLTFFVTKDSNAILGRMAMVVTLILTLTNILIAQQVLFHIYIYIYIYINVVLFRYFN